MQLNAEELKAARAKRSRLQKWIIYRKKEAIRKQQDLDEAEEEAQDDWGGTSSSPSCRNAEGREVELFATAGFRTHPSPQIPEDQCGVPEAGSYVVGELRWATPCWLWQGRPLATHRAREARAADPGESSHARLPAAGHVDGGTRLG